MLIYPEPEKGAGHTANKNYGQITIWENLQRYEYHVPTCHGEGNHLHCEMYLLLWCSGRDKSVFAPAGANARSP